MSDNRKPVLSGFGTGFPNALQGDLFFSWKHECGRQKAFSLEVKKHGRPFWSTGWLESRRTYGVKLPAEKLEEDMDYEACLILRMENGGEMESAPLVFWTGITDRNWNSEWLKPYMNTGSAPLFRWPFQIDRPVETVRLYICGLGYFTATVNGKPISEDLLGPGWGVYRKHVPYCVYDITERVSLGDNAMGVVLGQGWYHASLGHEIDTLLFSMQMSVRYADGSHEWRTIGRKHDWLVCSGGPILQNSIYDGEIYDARNEIPGWDTAGFTPDDPEQWKWAIVTEGPVGRMIPQATEPIRVVQCRRPERIWKTAEGSHVIDFGQNLAGFAVIELDEPAGTSVRFSFAEITDPSGHLNKKNLREAKAEDTYISSGRKALYHPTFTYHGFRYIEISGLTNETSLETLNACVIRNAVDARGAFACGNEMINRIQGICRWTESNNLHWVPTDCPQRDERLGWLNDLTVRAEEAVYNFELRAFFTAYLQMIADEQGEKTGAISDTAPYIKYGSQPADPVCSSFLVLGWLLYMHYGDAATLSRYYRHYAAWTDYLWSISTDGIVPYSYYGDWASPIQECDSESYGAGAVSVMTPGLLMSSGFLYYNARLMEKMSEVLNRNEDIAHWRQIASTTRDSLNRAYYHPETGGYATDSQAANTFMVWLGVAPDPVRTSRRILDSVVRRDYHIFTGNICSRYILEVLTEAGYVDEVFKVVTQTTYPSWGYMLENGATTTWERWEYVDSGPLLGMASHDHPMYATISAWFYRYLLGIQVETPGFDSFILKPYFPEQLPSAKGSLETIKGTIRTQWERQGEGIALCVEVPEESSCRFIPSADRFSACELDGTELGWTGAGLTLSPGRHQITLHS